ncbi:MAG: hypothetical protein ACFBSG_11550 [Leptolyngbyaceae cyanobacterium]
MPELPEPEQMADTSAERLMDDLFEGVERALEGDAEALETLTYPVDLAEPEPAAELTLNFTEEGLPPVLLDSAMENDAPTLAAVPTTLPALALETESESLATPANPPRGWRRLVTMNRALLGAAGLILLATLGLWMHQRQQVEAVTATAVPKTDVPTLPDHAEFLEYLRRSLDVIAQSNSAPGATADVGEVAIALNPGSTVPLPPVNSSALPPGTPGALSSIPGSVNVIERVYVPYPSAQAAPNSPAAQANVPPAINSGSSSNATASTNSGAVQNPHTLLGVLELGDRSAALFEIAGVPQRVYIGERVGNSGWSLVSVANEEAIIRRNGEVRTLYIGQQF